MDCPDETVEALEVLAMLKILVPVDGSELALDGVRHVMRLVHHGLKAQVVLVHVEPSASLFELMTTPDPQIHKHVAEDLAERAFSPAETLLNAMKVPVQREWAIGAPERVLVELIETLSCDMVVMGAGAFGDWRSALFGSVSHAVLNHAKVPVTLVRHQGP